MSFLDIFILIGEKIINWLVALVVKPQIKVKEFYIADTNYADKQRIKFTAIVSNNSNKTLSISEKYLIFYDDSTRIVKIPIVNYKTVKKKDVFDELNMLMPIDEIIILQPGESKKISFFDEYELSSPYNKVVFSYYTGRKTYNHIVNHTKGCIQSC